MTVIDYYSRYLLAAYLTPSYSALAAVEALVIARADPVTPLEVYEGKVRPQLPRWQAWARKAKAKLDAL